MVTNDWKPKQVERSEAKQSLHASKYEAGTKRVLGSEAKAPSGKAVPVEPAGKSYLGERGEHKSF